MVVNYIAKTHVDESGPMKLRKRAWRGLWTAALLAATAIAGIRAPAQEASIESVRIVTQPSGGTAAEPVWIIDDPVTVEVRYSAPLDASATGTLELELDEFGDGHGTKRTADCAVDDDTATLACTYFVREGDEGSGVSVQARAGVLHGTRLPPAPLPSAAASRADIDGIRLTIADVSVRLLDERDFVSPKRAAAAGDTVEVTLNFVDREEPYSPGFAVALALDNATRPMTYVDDGDGRPTFRYKVVDGDHDRSFRLALSGVDRLRDRNGNRGLAAGERVNGKFLVGSVRRVDARGPRITDIRVEGVPEQGLPPERKDAYTAGDQIGLIVTFDEPIIHGGVSLDVLVGTGSSAASRSAPCLSDPRNDVQLTCMLSVLAGWEDGDGIATPANPLAFGARGLEDPFGNRAKNGFAARSFPAHKVDAVAPRLTRATMDVPPARAGNSIVVKLTYSEAVKVGASGPSVNLNIEGGNASALASYASVSGGEVTLRYALTETDVDDYKAGAESTEDGCGGDNRCSVTWPGSITVETVTDAAGNPALAGWPPERLEEGELRLLSSSSDTTPPTVESAKLRSVPASGRYGIGSPIWVDLLFSEPVAMDDSRLQLKIGSGAAKDMELLDSAAPRLRALWTFAYTVTSASGSGRIGLAGIKLAAGADVLDASENGWVNHDPEQGKRQSKRSSIPVSLTGNAGDVDTTPPALASFGFLSTPAPKSTGPADGRSYYGEGETIAVQVGLSEKVDLAGRPPPFDIEVNVDSSQRPRDTYFAGLRDGTKLIFEYTVVSDDRDHDGVRATLVPNTDCTIKDLAGNGWTCQSATISSAAHRADGSIYAGAEEEDDDEGRGAQQASESQQPQDTGAGRISATARDASADPPDHYRAGDEIVIEVEVTPAVSFVQKPTLELDFDTGGTGCARLAAEEAPGREVSRLTFRCRVEPGDEDLDGIEARLTGRIVAAGGASADSLTLQLRERLLVDARPPALERVAIESTGPYKAGDRIVARATFSEPVTAGSGASMPLQVGTKTRSATLHVGARGRQLEFRYTFAAGDDDHDGVSIPALTAASLGAAVVDAAGNEAGISHPGVAASARQAVDTIAPAIAAIRVAGAARVYRASEGIVFEVTFTEAVRNAARATLTVTVGDAERELNLAAGDGDDRVLTFVYSVRDGDRGAVGVPPMPLAGALTDAVGNPALLTHEARLFPGVSADAVAPSLAATGALAVTSAPKRSDTYTVGEPIEVTATFDEEVVVTGSPQLTLLVGGSPRQALHLADGAADTVRFRYTVRAGDLDEKGVAIAANALRLPAGARIADAGGLAADIRHPALPSQPGHKVDGVVPRLLGTPKITSTPRSGDAYLAGETIELEVAFTEPVAASRPVSLALAIGTASVDAPCSAGIDRARLTCSYAVRAGDFDADGIGVRANSLSGAVADLAGNPASLDHAAVLDDAAHKVYAQPPEAVRSLENLTLVAGGDVETVDVAGAFAGTLLRLRVTTSDVSVAALVAAEGALVVRSGVEGVAEITVTATNPAGSASQTFAVAVITDPSEAAVLSGTLAAIGRGMLSSATSVIGARFELSRPGIGNGAALSVAGRSLAPGAMADDALRRQRDQGWLHAPPRHDVGLGGGRDLLAGSSFAMPLKAPGINASVGVWGAGDIRRLDSEPNQGVAEVSAGSAWLGIDARGDGWLVGTSLSRSSAEADYAFDGEVEGGGTLETQFTGFHPYASFDLGGATEVWVIGGIGSGEAELARTHVDRLESADLALGMIAGGLRRRIGLDLAGASFALKADAGFLRLEADEGIGAAASLAADVSRLRLATEATWEVGIAHPFVEVGGRFDGGDGATGSGVEVAGGVRLVNVGLGFGLEAKGRVLATHSAEGYSESGVSVTASFDPGAPGRGITLRLAPRWGDAADGTNFAWSSTVPLAGYGGNGWQRSAGRRSWGADGVLGYGLGLGSIPGLLTPYSQVHVAGDGDRRRFRLGLRYGLSTDARRSVRFDLFAEHGGNSVGGAAETRAMLMGEARF